jgi:hypothetical protein
LLIGRHDYWPGYTVDVIKSLDFDYWPELALTCDAITEQHRNDQQELDRMKSDSSRRR